MRRPLSTVRSRLVIWRVLVGFAMGTVLGTGFGAGLFVSGAALMAAIAGAAANGLAVMPWTDPVYTRAALHSLADIHVSGVSIAGPTHGGLVKIALQPGSSVLARLVAAGVSHTGVLGVGLLLLRAGVHGRRPALISLSVATQLEVAFRLVASPPSMGGLETIGLSFAVDASMPWVAGRRLVVSDLVSSVPPPILAARLVTLAFISAYVAAGLVITCAIAFRQRISAAQPARHRPAFTVERGPALRASLATTTTLLALSAIAAACQVAPDLAPVAASAAQLGEGQRRSRGSRHASSCNNGHRDRTSPASISTRPRSVGRRPLVSGAGATEPGRGARFQ